MSLDKLQDPNEQKKISLRPPSHVKEMEFCNVRYRGMLNLGIETSFLVQDIQLSKETGKSAMILFDLNPNSELYTILVLLEESLNVRINKLPKYGIKVKFDYTEEFNKIFFDPDNEFDFSQSQIPSFTKCKLEISCLFKKVYEKIWKISFKLVEAPKIETVYNRYELFSQPLIKHNDGDDENDDSNIIFGGFGNRVNEDD